MSIEHARDTDRILRLPAVIDLTGLSRASIYRQEKAGTFPRRVRLGPNSVGWRISSLRAWLAAREEVAA